MFFLFTFQLKGLVIWKKSCNFAADLVRGGREVVLEKGPPCGENPFNSNKRNVRNCRN